PYRAECIGFLPGLLSEPFCADRLEPDKPAVEEVTPPARGALWHWIREYVEKHRDAAEVRQICIAGPAGAGKSHFIGALVSWLASRNMKIAGMSCLPSDVPGIFSAWGDLLVQIGGGRVPETVRVLGAELTLDATLVQNLVRFLAEPVRPDTPVEGGLTPLQ